MDMIGAEVALYCGSCGRRLDKIRRALVRTRDWSGPDAYPSAGTESSIMSSSWKPSVQRRKAGDGRYRWVCHPKCGANYVKRSERIDAAYSLAVRDGRQEIVLGLDL